MSFIEMSFLKIKVLTLSPLTDPLSILKDSAKNGLSQDESFRSMASSFYNFLMTIGIIGLGVSIIICGLMLIKKDSRKRQEGKDLLLIKSIIAIAIFSFISIVSQILKITSSIV